jgi:hypothetical protein
MKNESQGKAEAVPAYDRIDWFLQELVGFANKWGVQTGLTLQIGGILVSGLVINGQQYFEEFATSYGSGFANDPEIGTGLAQLISTNVRVYQKPAANSELPPPNYIHLRQARFYVPGQRPIPHGSAVLWRGRISEVAGFTLGMLEDQPD